MLVAQPASPNSHGADDVFVAARGGRTDALKALVGRGADNNVADGSGTTPLMLAVLGGHLDTVLQLVMACGADMNRRDHSGRTALELAIAASNREASLALLLIATAKFSRPLSPLLPLTLLQRLQAWVADPKGKNEAAQSSAVGDASPTTSPAPQTASSQGAPPPTACVSTRTSPLATT